MNTRPWIPLIPYALAIALALWALPNAPDRIPTHWGPDGQPDAWGTPFFGYFQMILFMLPGSLLLIAIQHFSRADNRNRPIFNLLNLGLSLLTLIETANVIFDWDAVKTSLVSLGLLFTLLGNSLGKASPSAFLGVRTPWVYLSRRAWHATHRRAALWFTVYGLTMLIPGLLFARDMLVPWLYPIGIIAGLIVLVGGLTYGSYLDYKRDPNPEPVNLRPQANP